MNATINYRLYTLAEDGRILDTRTLVCRGDAEAIEQARALVEKDALELWSGPVFLGRFQPGEN